MVLRLSPHGESGLKYQVSGSILIENASLPAWGEWIEIGEGSPLDVSCTVSPRMGRVD